MKQLEINAGDTIGRWLVLTILNKKNRSGSYIYEVECTKCGKTYKRTFDHLQKDSCNSCFAVSRIARVGDISVNLFNRIRDGAVSRNLPFNVTIEQLWDLFLAQNGFCALSGIKLSFDIHSKVHNKRRSLTTASLDRKDSMGGYFIDNLQWVHKKINRMKMDMSDDEFISVCKAVANKKENIPNTRIVARTEVEGIHRWAKCPIPQVSFLKQYHRHVFHINAICFVNHNDRDVEFIKLAQDIKQYLSKQYFNTDYNCLFFDDMSCEMIAHELVNHFNLAECEVNEDGEGGAIVKNI